MIDPPNVEGKTLAEMSQNHLQRWMAIEQPGGHQPQRVDAGLDCECPGCRRQPWKSVVNGLAARQGMTGKKIERLAARGRSSPTLCTTGGILIRCIRMPP